MNAFLAAFAIGGMAATSTSAHLHSSSLGADEPAIDVEALVSVAVEGHPSVEAEKGRARALRQRVEPAGALRDPMFTLGMLNNPIDRFSLRATPMTGIQLGVSQHLPWPGKLALRTESARKLADASASMVDERRNAISLAVRLAYYDIHFTDVAISVAKKNVGIIGDFVEIADAKYRVGKGLQQDVLKARVQRDQIKERVIALERMRDMQRIRLNNLLARPETTLIASLVNVPVRPMVALSAEALMEYAITHRPRLIALRRKIEAATSKEILANKQKLPDFNVGLGYRIRFPPDNIDPVDGANFWSLTVGVNLPVYTSSKQDPLARAAQEDVTAIKHELDAAILQIRRVVEAELSQLPRYIEQMELYRTAIIPNTRQSLEADRIAYQVDRVDFLNLLDIEMRLFNFEVDYHRLHVAREKAIVRIAHAIGAAPGDLARVAAAARKASQ